MSKLLVLKRENLEKTINNLENIKDKSPGLRDVILTEILVLKQLIQEGTDGSEIFEAAREFNSKDGIVDVHIVLNIGQHDISDLSPLYPNYQDYLKSLDNEQ